MSNPYNINDENLLNTFHRESPDFDLMNSVNDELHKIAAAPCRVYKLDHTKSVKDKDNIYGEYIYRTYLPPVIVPMVYTEPTWTEELSRMGINMPEQVVFSTNLQRLIETMRQAKINSSSANAKLTISFNWQQTGQAPSNVEIYSDGEGRLYSKLIFSDHEEPDMNFELNFKDEPGYIDLNHAAVNTVGKLASVIDSIQNYSATFEGNGDVLSSRMVKFTSWQSIIGGLEILIDRTGGIYDNVSDVIESGDIIETFRRNESTREAVEGRVPVNDPVTLQEVRGKLYEVRYSFVANETPTWHYINFNITADKVAMDTLGTLLDKLPHDEPWTFGGDKWYA